MEHCIIQRISTRQLRCRRPQCPGSRHTRFPWQDFIFLSAVSCVCPPQIIPSVTFTVPCATNSNYEYTPKGGQTMASYGTGSHLMVTAAGCFLGSDKLRLMYTEPRAPDVNVSRTMNTAVPSKNACP
ncbi:hypothetical protein EDB85DRAFT_2040018 [Lactarius pseudohatsudake]|nr:hypothetical protein EDB85DRAFT_2040018 [Lactarius pseudohatsudake]